MKIDTFVFKRVKNWSDSKLLDEDFTVGLEYMCQCGNVKTNKCIYADVTIDTMEQMLGSYEIIAICIGRKWFYES